MRPYIKIRDRKVYIWFIMDARCSIRDYHVSDNHSVDPCILTMCMTFREIKKLLETFRFVTNGYSAYPLPALQIAKEMRDDFKFNITQVIGLTNDDAFSKDSRPYKPIFERLYL